MRNRLLTLVLLAACWGCQSGPGDALLHVEVENGVRAKMRDDVELVADVYRPETGGPYPVLLTRTPYDRRGGAVQARSRKCPRNGGW